MQVTKPAPSTTPLLEETAKARHLPKQIPTATKAVPPVPPVPPKADVQSIARPLSAPVAPPKVAGPPAVPAASARPVPSKRPQELENTASKMQRLMASKSPHPAKEPPAKAPAKAESKAPPVNRTLTTELDSVSDSKGNPEPNSSLVFPHGAHQPVYAKASAVFTPEPSLAEAPANEDTSLSLTQVLVLQVTDDII